MFNWINKQFCVIFAANSITKRHKRTRLLNGKIKLRDRFCFFIKEHLCTMRRCLIYNCNGIRLHLIFNFLKWMKEVKNKSYQVCFRLILSHCTIMREWHVTRPRSPEQKSLKNFNLRISGPTIYRYTVVMKSVKGEMMDQKIWHHQCSYLKYIYL